jgi:signal peptidase II
MKSNRNLYIIFIVVLNIILDQFSKFWIRVNIPSRMSSGEENPHLSLLSENPYPEEVNLISNYFTLLNVENAGAFLGLGSEFPPLIKKILLLALPVVVLITVLVYVFKDKSIDKLSLIGFSSIIGGGLGNIYDRFLYGSVTDFLFIDLGGVFKTGIFNIADLSVTTGMILILWASFKNKKQE